MENKEHLQTFFTGGLVEHILSRAVILRIPESVMVWARSSAQAFTKRNQDPPFFVMLVAIETMRSWGIYKPLRKVCNGANLSNNMNVPYFVPYFTGRPHFQVFVYACLVRTLL